MYCEIRRSLGPVLATPGSPLPSFPPRRPSPTWSTGEGSSNGSTRASSVASRWLEARANRLDQSWIASLDAGAMYCKSLLGDFAGAREFAVAFNSSEGADKSDREVLCPSVLSQAALAVGALAEAATLAAGALEAASALGFDRHYYEFCALRTTGLLALERRDLATAASVMERALDLVGTGGRPVFDYLAQLDRARLWATRGELDEALASLPQAREALRSDRSPLLLQADELEARFRLSLGDLRGAETAMARLPHDRRRVMTAMVALAAGDPRRAGDELRDAPEPGATDRCFLELRLLQASAAAMLASPRAHELVGETLTSIERSGFVQTVLDTAPQFVDHLVESGSSYPRGKALSALVAARLEDGKLSAAGRGPWTARSAHRGRDPRPRKAVRASDLCRDGVRPSPLAEHRQDPPPSHVYEARRNVASVGR